MVLFEKNDCAGGHAHTVTVPSGPDAGTAVDTGFIVMNHRNYPLFSRLLDQLGVELKDSSMSFAYWDQNTGLQYDGSGLGGLFAQRRNLLRPSHYRMVGDIFRFFREADRDLRTGSLRNRTLGEYLEKGRYSDVFVRHHLVPMSAAIWSTPDEQMLEFPAESFVQFFHNHGLLTVNDRPLWRTVKGGSRSYVDRILQEFNGQVRLSSPVSSVVRIPPHVAVACPGSAPEEFDAAVIAVHADEALALLADPSAEESRLLGPWRYQPNDTVLHSDASAMPPLTRIWSSWNYVREQGSAPSAPAALTYWMNRLQGLDTRSPLFVSLNLRRQPAPSSTIMRATYTHPTYSSAALSAQTELQSLNGRRNTWFCGSYFGYGFHEDAVRSGVQAARAFGVDL